MKRLLFLPSLMILLLATSCTTYHFGVKDRASQVPDEFGQTEIAIVQAEQSPGAKYCPEKITKARDLGRQAADAYWACHNDEASRLLAEARRLAAEAERCGPAPQAYVQPVVEPQPAPAPLPERITMTLNVEFDFDKSDVKPKYHDVIGKLAEFMKQYPNTTTVIEGHTDNRGKYEYNIRLSERRAESVRSYLVEKFDIDPSRLTIKGYGYTKPVATNDTDEGRQRNRRIDAMIEVNK
jgi:outer membrane protein OmpA-like peptidoglycan-associated protein